jgi:membrane associated rhomboid family serine protease
MTEADKERKIFVFRLFLALLIVSLWWMVALFAAIFDYNMLIHGIKPRNPDSIYAIFTFPFIHGSWSHLVSNSLPGVILLTGLFIFHARKSWLIITLIYLFSGIILWFIGRSGTNHVGASGFIYGLAFFLFTAGLIIRDRSSVAVSFFMILWYGGMLWGIFPFSVEPGTSWEGHLSGAVTGVILAILITKKSDVASDGAEAADEEHFYEKNRIEDFDYQSK